MARKKGKVYVSEEFRISVNLSLKKFRQDEKEKEREFPSSFTSSQRAYIHRYCIQLGLKSKSRGQGTNRYITVYKKEGSTIVQADAIFDLTRSSKSHILTLLHRFPVSSRERQELLPLTERERLLAQETRNVSHMNGRVCAGIPQVPPCVISSEYLSFRRLLPIWNSREEILQYIIRHQVVLISGETGSGKTTQVPQFILDHSSAMNQPCRIICTQPRRIAALSVSERVAMERGEKIGQSVGYQIRLESKLSSKTLLTFCTNGVLLRTLMCSDSFLATVTHIIVDELHERDRFSDFLLTILRDMLLKFRNLKLILMSAVLDMQLFIKYFGGCPIIEVPGRLFDVRTYFLEDILKNTGYTNKAMKKYKEGLSKSQSQRIQLESWCSSVEQSAVGAASNVTQVMDNMNQLHLTDEKSNNSCDPEYNIDPMLTSKMDAAIHQSWLTGSDESFANLFSLLLSENIPVDYQHSETSVTPLMVASGRGNLNAIEQLLALGANVHLRSSNEWNAIDFAQHFSQKEIVEILESHVPDACPNSSDKDADGEHEISEEEKFLLDAYLQTTDDEKVDTELILFLLKHICCNHGDGSVLIFLPGYDDIVSLRDKILADCNFSDHSRFILFVLHSQMQSLDQKRVFKPVPHGMKKIAPIHNAEEFGKPMWPVRRDLEGHCAQGMKLAISVLKQGHSVILSTNIAETSVTVNDVVYVIDSGKVKEKCFDALNGTTQLRTSWVSQANAVQRKGRAGRCRPGICYHLFSRMRFHSLQKFQVPEILRVPIHELCLQAKLLAPPNVPIADFLARAPDPPPFMVTRNAVNLLKMIDALDQWEELTSLGLHLLDLPIEPRWGKMILYSVVLKCLDPILTIACTLAYREPFMLPSNPSQKKESLAVKKKLSCNTFSDHMALLKAFQAWQKAKSDGYEHSFCNKNFLSPATMEMIAGMRAQMIGQLRATGFLKARGGSGDLRDLNTNSDSWAVVKAALCAGSYPNLIRIDRERQQLITQKESKVRFHTSSVLNKFPSSGAKTVGALHNEMIENLRTDWLIYEEMSRLGRTSQAHCCTLVSPIAIAIFCGPARLPFDALNEPEHGQIKHQAEESESEEETPSDSQKVTFKLDDWVSFKLDPEVARLTLQLRQKWCALFLRRVHMPSKMWSQVDEAVVRSIVNVLIAEEQILGLQQPNGLGTKIRSSAPGDIFSLYGQMPNVNAQNFCNPPQSSVQQSYKLMPEAMNTSDANKYFSTNSNVPHNFKRNLYYKQKGTFYGPRDHSDCSSVQSLGSGGGSVNASPSLSPAHSGASHKQRKSDYTTFYHKNMSRIRYFIIKTQHPKLLDMSLISSTWVFTPIMERKLLGAAKEEKDVILILLGNSYFHGLARFIPQMADQRTHDPSAAFSGRCYYIEWLKRGNISFQNTQHLQNPWNDNRRVQCSRDGQELEPTVGEMLCKLWERYPPVSMCIPSDRNTLIHPGMESDHSANLPTSSFYDFSNASMQLPKS